MTALLFAAIQCKAAVVNVLLLAGANVNAQNKVNIIYSVIHTINMHVTYIDYVILLQDGKTGLMRASLECHIATMGVLLRAADADINMQDKVSITVITIT